MSWIASEVNFSSAAGSTCKNSLSPCFTTLTPSVPTRRYLVVSAPSGNKSEYEKLGMGYLRLYRIKFFLSPVQPFLTDLG